MAGQLRLEQYTIEERFANRKTSGTPASKRQRPLVACPPMEGAVLAPGAGPGLMEMYFGLISSC